MAKEAIGEDGAMMSRGQWLEYRVALGAGCIKVMTSANEFASIRDGAIGTPI